MNYYDKTKKKWELIDNTLKPCDNGYIAQIGNYTVRLSKESDNETVEITNGSDMISWEYLGLNRNVFSPKSEQDKKHTKQKSKLVVKSNNNSFNLAKSSRAIYKNAEGNIDLDYLIEGNGIKEKITVKDKSESYRYYFMLRVLGFSMKLASNSRAIEFYKDDVNSELSESDGIEPEFIMPAPFMFDDDGNRSDEVYYDYEDIGNGNYIFTIDADEEWINAPERVFPVYIDPQLVTSNSSNISLSHVLYNLVTYCHEGYCTSSWMKEGEPYYDHIHLEATKLKLINAILTIKKRDIDIRRNKMISAKLVFEAYSNQALSNAGISIEETYHYKHFSDDKVIMDITDMYNSSEDAFDIEIKLFGECETCDLKLPTLEITYQSLNSYEIRKPFALVEGANLKFGVLSGNGVIEFEDISDSALGLRVSHLYKPGDENNKYGQNFRLNLDENLSNKYTYYYTYTDEYGDVHSFNENFYYIGENGEKTYVLDNEDKELIRADADGRLWLNRIEVFRELRTNKGLIASSRLNGINNAEWVEQRLDEEKQLEEQVKSYKNTLCNFSAVNEKTRETTSNMTESTLDSPDSVETFLSDIDSESNPLLSKEEVLSYKTLLTQKESLTVSKTALDLQKESLKNSAKSLLLQYNSPNTFAYQTASNTVQGESLKLEKRSAELIKNGKTNVVSGTNNTNNTVTIDPEYNAYLTDVINHIGINDSNAPPENTKNWLLNYSSSIINDQKKNWEEQKKLIASQICNFDYQLPNTFPPVEVPQGNTDGTLTQQYNNIENQIVVVDEQLSDIDAQIELFNEKSTNNINQFRILYKEYLNLKNQFAALKAQIPVSYLISDSTVKGFNENGELVIIQDKYENYIVIEREKYNASGNTRISSVYDKDGHTMSFVYNQDNMLSQICNSIGERTCFRYNSDKYLVSIEREHLPSVSISYDTISGVVFINKLTSSNHNSASISYNDIGMLTGITYYTKVTNISHDNVATSASNSNLSALTVNYTPTDTRIVYDNIKEEIYVVNQTEERIDAYYELINGKVANAERYTYSSYLITKTERPSKCCLNLHTYADFENNMTIGTVENVTYNSFNEPLLTETYRYDTQCCNNCPGESTLAEKTSTEYTYNDNRKLTEKKTSHSYCDCCGPFETDVIIEKYYYNNAGDIVRTESYVEGEQLKTGVNIEEHVYNEKGVEIQSFTYNSLDPSSKFYTENEVDESGRAISAFDDSGEHKTIFVYDRTGVNVKTECLPNGSKFSYAKTKDGAVTAITHSTESGEENSTTQLRTLDVVTEVKSGNNTVRYEYDKKRRVKAVSLNGTDDYVKYVYTGDNTDNETVKATFVNAISVTSIKDIYGNVKKITCGNRTVTNTYDNKHQLTKTVDNVSGTTDFTYNKNGNLTSVTAPDHTEAFVYNDVYNTLESKTISGSGINHSYSYSYNITADKSLDCILIDGKTVRPSKDALGRNTGKTIGKRYTLNNELHEDTVSEEKISYVKFGDHATSLPSTVRFAANGVFNEFIKYKYDSMGNIIEVSENGRSTCRYEYDALGRLTREDNVAFNKTTAWAYDNNGNIIARYEYALTAKPTSELHSLNADACKLYTYADNSDQLMSYDGKTFEYDNIGNPTMYKDNLTTWAYGRCLTSYNGNTFSYDARGRRISKKNGTSTAITFTYDCNGNLIKQSNGLEFLYDHTGVFALKYNGSTYFYRKNAQNDIIALLDSNGSVVVKYMYDAWGNCEVFNASRVEITDDTHIGILNPFRYRSYYYDTETNLYFLKTRYYDPEIGRFMTIDDLSYLDPESINGLNLYAYCLNNPIKYSDPNGTSITLGVILGIVALAGLITTCIGVGTDNNIVTAIGLTMVAVPALISGGLALVGGITAGATLTAIVGGVTALAGIGTGLFASAEYQEAFTGNNWILETTGMSESLYNGLMIAIATIATLGTFASSFAYNFKIKSVDKVGKLRPQNHPDEGYFGVRFKDARGSLKSIEIQKHAPHGLHFQLNSWNPMHMSVKTIRRWTWYLTRM